MNIRTVNKTLRTAGFAVNGKTAATRNHRGEIVQSSRLPSGADTYTNSDGSVFVSVNRAKDCAAIVAALEAAGATVTETPFFGGYNVA